MCPSSICRAVAEHDTSQALAEFRQQRYARISRRCGTGRQQAAASVRAAAQRQASVAQAVATTTPDESTAEAAASDEAVQQERAAEQEGPATAAAAEKAASPSTGDAAQDELGQADAGASQRAAEQTVDRADASSTAAEAAPHSAAAAAVPKSPHGSATCVASSPPPPAAGEAAWEQLQAGGFAVASDAELTDDEAEEERAAASSCSLGSLPDAAAVGPRQAGSQQQLPPPPATLRPANCSSAASLAEIRSSLRRLDCQLNSAQLGARQQQAANLERRLPLPPPSSQPVCSAEPALAEPVPALAVPAPNSSVIAAHRRLELEAQVRGDGCVRAVGCLAWLHLHGLIWRCTAVLMFHLPALVPACRQLLQRWHHWPLSSRPKCGARLPQLLPQWRQAPGCTRLCRRHLHRLLATGRSAHAKQLHWLVPPSMWIQAGPQSSRSCGRPCRICGHHTCQTCNRCQPYLCRWRCHCLKPASLPLVFWV